MRRVLGVLLGVSVLLGSLGCAQFSKEAIYWNRTVTKGVSQDRSMTESYTEQMHRFYAVVDQDARAIVDDIDLVLQRDRPTRLTRWHDR